MTLCAASVSSEKKKKRNLIIMQPISVSSGGLLGCCTKNMKWDIVNLLICTISSNHLFKTLDISWSFSPGFSPGWKKRGWHIMTGDPIRSQAHLTRWTPLLTGWQIGEKGRAWSTYKCTPALPLKTLWKRVPGAQLLSNSWFIRNVWTGLNLRVRAEVFLHYRWRSDFSFYLNYLEYNRHVSAAT